MSERERERERYTRTVIQWKGLPVVEIFVYSACLLCALLLCGNGIHVHTNNDNEHYAWRLACIETARACAKRRGRASTRERSDTGSGS